MPIDSVPHLVVAFAACPGDDWLQAASALKLNNLEQVLRGMKLIDTDNGQADSLSPPHERVLSKALAKTVGLTTSADGLIPWAAHEAKALPGQAWAVITPCHWAMGREHATLTDPATLELTEEQSRTLLAAMQPYFATEGITLHYAAPTRWLAQGDIFSSLPTASLDRVLGRNVDRWLPPSKAIKLLQNEMQMLLYTHPVNDDRASKGRCSVNSFWISGSGALTAPAADNPQASIHRALAPAALASDWAAYGLAWATLDASTLAFLLAQQKSGTAVRISLCGESNALTFETGPVSIVSKIKNILSPQILINLLKQL